MITGVPFDFISANELRTHLRKTTSADDGQLMRFASAACQMIVERVGQVSPVAAISDGCVRGGVFVLEHRPVVSVTSVVQLPGGEAMSAGDPIAGTAGWVLTSPEGVLSVPGWSGRVRVTYVAGRDPVPATFTMAALELAAHLWRSSQLNQSGGRPALGDGDQTLVPGTGYALPHRVRELLGLSKLPHDEPLVG